MAKRIGIVVVFLVGCAVGGGASAFVVPKASATLSLTSLVASDVCARRVMQQWIVG